MCFFMTQIMCKYIYIFSWGFRCKKTNFQGIKKNKNLELNLKIKKENVANYTVIIIIN